MGLQQQRTRQEKFKTQQLMPVWVSRWWQELTHPCKYLKNNNWRTSRPFPTYLINNSNNCQGLATQRQKLITLVIYNWHFLPKCHTHKPIKAARRLSQNNRMAPPRIHTFTVESNENRKQIQNRQLLSSYRDRQLPLSYENKQLSSSHEREQ